MDYSKFTKDELIDMLEKQKHLPSVVKQKNKEIEDLKERHAKELEDAQKRTEKRYEELADQNKQLLNQYEQAYKKAKETIGDLVGYYGALLKTLQGVTDSHIYINDSIIKNYKE